MTDTIEDYGQDNGEIIQQRPQQRQLAKRPMETIKSMFEASKSKLAQVVPKYLTPDRLLRVAVFSISKSPKLQECTPLSLLNGVMEAGRLGLEIGGTTGEAYLVPFSNKGILEAQFIAGYQGLQKLARNSSTPYEIEAVAVRAGDDFHWQRGTDPKIEHTPDASMSGDITHFYAIGFPANGGRAKFEVMTKAQVDAIRKRSRAANNGPWVTDYEPMGKKTVVKRLCKYLPQSPELAEALAAGDEELDDTITVTNGQSAQTTALNRQLADAQTPAPDDVPTIQRHETTAAVPSPTPATAPRSEPPPSEQSQPMSEHDEFMAIAEECYVDQDHDAKAFANALKKSLVALGKVGKAKDLTPGERDEILKAIHDRRGFWA